MAVSTFQTREGVGAGEGGVSPLPVLSPGPACRPAPPGCSVMADEVRLPRASRAVLGQGSGCEGPTPRSMVEVRPWGEAG